MARRKKEIRLDLRLYPDSDTDLIEWLDSMATLPHGYKVQAIKTALRQGMGQGNAIPASTNSAGLDQIQTLLEALHRTLDLNQIRAVVEAAVASSLTRQGATIIQTAPAPVSEESSLLTHMVSGLMLEEDEE